MKKTLTLIIFILLTLVLLLPSSKADFDVNPRELYVTMTDKFINGNTSKSILVFNTGSYDINVTWYLDNPTEDKIRENRTIIPDLNWIDLDPTIHELNKGNSTSFYIILNIPENKIYLNQHWEVWVTFKPEKSDFITFEHAVRLYIDTPTNLTNQNSSNSEIDYKNSIIFGVVVIAIIVVVIFFILRFLHKKK
jgi:hypothetical protein